MQNCDCLNCINFTDCGIINNIILENKTLMAIHLINTITAVKCLDFEEIKDASKLNFTSKKNMIKDLSELKRNQLESIKNNLKQGEIMAKEKGKMEKPKDVKTEKPMAKEKSGTGKKKPC